MYLVHTSLHVLRFALFVSRSFCQLSRVVVVGVVGVVGVGGVGGGDGVVLVIAAAVVST